jgi:hypothetical protein
MADRIAMENAVKRGELVDSADASQLYAAEVMRAKARLLQCPHAAGQHVPAEHRAAVVGAVDRVVREALEELASGDSDGVDATDETDG